MACSPSSSVPAPLPPSMRIPSWADPTPDAPGGPTMTGTLDNREREQMPFTSEQAQAILERPGHVPCPNCGAANWNLHAARLVLSTTPIAFLNRTNVRYKSG